MLVRLALIASCCLVSVRAARADDPPPGDRCETAQVLAGSLPISVSGTTEGFADDYDFACPYSSNAPDVVYLLVPQADVRVDITLCTGPTDFDTKLYIYENECTSDRAPLACSEDACSSPVLFNYVSALIDVHLLAGNSYYVVIDGYGAASGTFYMDITEHPSQGDMCPDPYMLGLNPDGDRAAKSDFAAGYRMYERFDALDSPITGLHWWGINAYFSGGAWIVCDKGAETFEIVFYTDAGGAPGAAVCTFPSVVATRIDSGLIFEIDGGPAWPVYAYDVALSPACSLSTGWVSITGHAGGGPCWHLWVSSTQGDGQAWQELIGFGRQATDYDLSVCFLRDPILGACCDDLSGICLEDVEIADCTGRFLVGQSCGAFDPPCGEALGACCYTDGTCAIVAPADCPREPNCPGDMDCDGDVDFDDIDAFVQALESQAGYEAAYPNCRYLNADVDGDGDVDFDDIDPFVGLLGAGVECPMAGIWLGPGTGCESCGPR